MPTWARTLVPTDATWPQFPGALVAVGQSGKTQLRATAQIGRVWTETYGPLRRGDVNAQAFLAAINNYWRNGTLFQIDHRGQRGLFGVGSGSPTVNGASQTGASLVTTGWTATTTNILRAGDVILLPGITVVYDVTADVNSGAAGAATIPINPPLFAGTSPTNGGAIVRNNVAGNVTYRARLADVQMPKAGPNEFYQMLTLTFVEVP